MYNKEDINKLYRDIATSIDISDDMFSAAVDEYMSLGKWIDENTPKYRISIKAPLGLVRLSSQSQTMMTMILIWFVNLRNNMV